MRQVYGGREEPQPRSPELRVLCLLPLKARMTPCGGMPVLMGSSPRYETRIGGVGFLARFGWWLSVDVDFRVSSGCARYPTCVDKASRTSYRISSGLFQYNSWFHPVTPRPRGLSEVETRLGLSQDNLLRSTLLHAHVRVWVHIYVVHSRSHRDAAVLR